MATPATLRPAASRSLTRCIGGMTQARVQRVPTRLVAVAFDAREPTAVGRFWAELLGREVVDEDDTVLLPGDERQVGLRFVVASTQERGARAGTKVQHFPKGTSRRSNVHLRRSAACYAVDFGSGAHCSPTTTQARLARPSTASSA